MHKKCIICDEEPGIYMIKGTGDCYCKKCAEDSFSDLSYLVKVEEQAKALKEAINDQMEEIMKDHDEDKKEE